MNNNELNFAEKLSRLRVKKEYLTPIDTTKNNASDEDIKKDVISVFKNLSELDKERYISNLEDNKILLSDNTLVDNEKLSNEILSNIIALGLDQSEDSWIKEVKEAVRIYADDYLYDSVIMWCEAVKYDRMMCQPIIKGHGKFFQDVELLGYPHLCLLIKAIKK